MEDSATAASTNSKGYIMNESLYLLTLSAASIGFIHTLIGPDHYLPFALLARARNWPLKKTLSVTFLCGVGHVLSSIVLGAIGIAAGVALQHLELIEELRGELAAWLLIAFGLLYGAWGLNRAMNRSRSHAHEGLEHAHPHIPFIRHSHHGHDKTIGSLFAIFVLGPCEPLIPLLMFPAAMESTGGIVLVSLVFSIATIATMMAMVTLISLGSMTIPMKPVQRYMHAIAGGTIAVSGIAIQLFGV